MRHLWLGIDQFLMRTFPVPTHTPLGALGLQKISLPMNTRAIAVACILFLSSAAIASQKVTPATYREKDAQEAAKALLEVARAQAESGSWELISVGRIYYLGGFKPEGKEIFDKVLARQPEPSDLLRIAQVYREAGDWAQAKVLFDRYVSENPKDAYELAKIGSYYMSHGDRADAEALFDRSFKLESDLWSTLAAAGGYLGVAPQD